MVNSITVVIPVYNSAKTIRDCLASAIAQPEATEIIVIDDCSTDNSYSLLQALKKDFNDKRLVLLQNEKNLGVAKTRNKAVGIADSEYIAFLDSDDYWAKDKLKQQLQLVEDLEAYKEKWSIIATARVLINQQGKIGKRIAIHNKSLDFKELLKGNAINCSSVLVKKEYLLEFPMGNDDVHEDYLCWLNIVNKYGRAYIVDEPLLYYRVNNESKSGSKRKSAITTYRTYRRFGFGIFKSSFYFINYVIKALRKYYL